MTKPTAPATGFLSDLLVDPADPPTLLVLRNYATLPHSTGGSDVDVMAAPWEGHVVLTRINRSAHQAGGGVIGISRSFGFAKACTFGRENGNGGWWGVRVDILDGLTLGGMPVADSDFARSMAGRHNGIPVFKEPASDVFSVLKELLANQTFPVRYAAGASRAFREMPDQLETLFAPIGETAYGLLRDICLSSEEDTGRAHKIRRLCKAVKAHDFRSDPVRHVQSRFLFYWSRLRRFLSPPGIVVAILGTDGAGKSTILEEIRPVFEAATHMKLPQRHLRPGLLPALGDLRHGRLKRDSGGIVTDPHGAAPAGPVGSLSRLVWLWLDYVLGYWAVVRPSIARTPTVFLFDRYADDLALDPKRFRIGRCLRLARALPDLVPRPDIIIALHAKPEAIHARKTELPIEEVRRQVDALKAWVAQHPEAVLVDTEGSVEEARDVVLTSILNFIRDRR